MTVAIMCVGVGGGITGFAMYFICCLLSSSRTDYCIYLYGLHMINISIFVY